MRYVNLSSLICVLQAEKTSRENRYRIGAKNNRLYCLVTNRPKSKCPHCNINCYTGSDGHKYCSTNHIRRVLCSCSFCLQSKMGGKALCIHGKQKPKCKECGGKSLCDHGIQNTRCVQCFREGKRPSGLCEHGREKWRPCRDCDEK